MKSQNEGKHWLGIQFHHVWFSFGQFYFSCKALYDCPGRQGQSLTLEHSVKYPQRQPEQTPILTGSG